MKLKAEDYKIRFARKTDIEGIARLKFEGDKYHSQFDLWPPECDMTEARNTIKKYLIDKHSKIFVALDDTSNIIGFIISNLVIA